MTSFEDYINEKFGQGKEDFVSIVGSELDLRGKELEIRYEKLMKQLDYLMWSQNRVSEEIASIVEERLEIIQDNLLLLPEIMKKSFLEWQERQEQRKELI
jgi:hypothetical protein